MQTLNEQFAQAVRNVSIGDKQDRAIAAHTEVRELLENDSELLGWGIDTRLIGSYARLTSRYPAKDVDVFLRFTNLSVRHDPEKIYNAVERVLAAEYGIKNEDPDGRVVRQARSLNVDFSDPELPEDQAFSIDAVPAVPKGDNWAIPNRNRDKWDSEQKRWIETNPIKFADDTNALSTSPDSPTVASANAYRHVVRLLRQVRHEHLGSQKPGGLFVEVAAFYDWDEGLVTGSTYAELLAATLRSLATRFSNIAETGLPDPVLGTPMKPELDSWQWNVASGTFGRLADTADEALKAKKCRAAKLWRDILGTNDRGSVLPLPEGCDAGGFPIGNISAVAAVGSNQPRGFAFLPIVDPV